jgi:hypothetical protein
MRCDSISVREAVVFANLENIKPSIGFADFLLVNKFLFFVKNCRFRFLTEK